MKQIRREVTLTPGPSCSEATSPLEKRKKFADYVLSWEPGIPVAVVEAKDNHYGVSPGLHRPGGYAEVLDVPCGFSSNGDAFASHNKVPYPEEEIETNSPWISFPHLRFCGSVINAIICSATTFWWHCSGFMAEQGNVLPELMSV